MLPQTLHALGEDCGEALVIEGLEQIVRRVHLIAFHRVLAARRDEEHQTVRIHLTQPAGGLQAVDAVHVDVKQDEVAALRREGLQEALAVREAKRRMRHSALRGAAFDIRRKPRAVRRKIVHNGNAHRASTSFPSKRAAPRTRRGAGILK